MNTYLNSLNQALHQAFEADTSVYFLGEDIVDPYGGAFKVSKGLSTVFPERVFSTPISEGGITGVAAGMALRGLKPVVEIMFGDFLTLCVDQIVNHIAKFRGMYNEKVAVPIVIRTPMGGGRGYGATHSQSIEKMFLGIPGVQVVAPSHLHDPGAQLRYSILEKTTPVLFIEHKLLYPTTLLKDTEGMHLVYYDEIEGFPTAGISNFSSGDPDITLIAYGGISREIVPLMQELVDEEIRVFAVFPASLSPLPIETLVKAAGRSGKVIIVEEGTAGFNWGSEVSSKLYERLFNRLSRPIHCLASAAAIIPAARELEDGALVNRAQIEAAILEILT